ncbi:MAG TPA: dienelactone hydrolase family protein [Candidatus Binatia bacterium]|jgi:carboxymethylenebutenolidase|nr:dienelactone hydrolase family protein [Candidatus Binatia bacterium]
MDKKDTLRKHGEDKVSRREFLRKSALTAGSAVAANALGNLLVSAPASAAQVDANDPALISADVKYPSVDGVGLSGYLTRPKGDDKRPAVIVIHGWTGIDDHIRDVGRRLAKAGYVALVPDLLSRSGGTHAFSSGEAATKELYRLGDEMFTKDLSGAVNYLNGQNFVRANKIGVTGFCWGGGRALMFTTRNKDLAASVIYYGENPQNLEDVRNITVPVLGQYGGADERITSGVPQLEAAMKKYGKSFEYKIYPGAPHAFFTDTSPRSYREEAAKEAWGRTLEFFKKHLQS